MALRHPTDLAEKRQSLTNQGKVRYFKGSPGHTMVDWGRVDWLRPFGRIRIEDNVRVLEGGQENLTRDAFDSLG